ncbi:UvrD-helicase-domain-containing protein [Coniochaeta ligniaria NRRL 30616]|uniref:DNA 3'-5' helicase n=1 Tax=Coniochaeta ligniaria NRRL 30616 TaxID=1408157 RepID=A0A1J7IA75_9PEZI|nr:UvrD-helicase-domain-containing protein [Coniochaeta ligniaria NRRL 30616]
MSPPAATNDIFKSLNEAQSRAVRSNADTVAILAGPGSGKTHTLTSRVVYLVDTLGYQPQDVIVATFTVKAAREMTERIGKALGQGREKKIILGTFHSVARRYLAAYGQRIGLNQKFGIADDGDSRGIISRICKRLQLTVDPPMARAWISKKKAKGTEPEPNGKKQAPAKGVHVQELETCYKEYQSHLERSNLLDYDDLLVRCVELLTKHPSCVSNVQAVLIDEYQDTNGVQYELMKLFAQARHRITIVGDPDQSIYGWRSAEIRNLWRLLRDFPGTEEVSLEENYRSSQSILDMSLTVIQQDTKRYKKALRPIHNKGTRPVLRRLKTSAMEADWVVSEIRRAIMMSGEMMTHNDIAILLRSASLSRHIEHALGKAGVAYKMVGGFKFYERMEIKVLLDYLRVVHQPENNDALARIMNVPKRGIGDVTIKALVEEAEKSSTSLFSLLDKHCCGGRQAKTRITKQAEQKISADLLRLLKGIRKRVDEISQGTPFGLIEMIEQLLTQLKFQKFLQDTYADDHEQRWANVQEFMGLAADFIRDLDRIGDDGLPEIEGLQQSKEVDVLPKFLSQIALASDTLKDDETQQNKAMVTISTIHAAKGLEWPIVFVPAAYTGSIPHARAEDNDEERRLLYVAMTRAQALLYLSCPLYGSHGNGEKQELSSFLTPIERYFAKKGPCFDRPVMSEVARILQRSLPSEDSIYKSMPPMSVVEDDLFPEDPEQAIREVRKAGGAVEGGYQESYRAKRPRLYGPAGETAPQEEPWRKDYATTMEQTSSFTVSTLPGFVSAGTAQAALAAAAASAKAKQPAQNAMKTSANKRPPDQRSIMGFVKSAPGQTSTSSNPPTAPVPAHSAMSNMQYLPPKLAARATAYAPPRPAIEPSLSKHRLAATKMARPVLPKREEADFASKQYNCFSSSPTKPPGDENPSAIAQSTLSEENEPPPEPTRPAGSFHNTTCNMPKGLGGGFRRPAGLGRESIAPMDRLRKPFKPLTMNRP